MLRREIYYEGLGGSVDAQAPGMAAGLRFADRASPLTIGDYLHAHDVLIARRDHIEAELEQLAKDSPRNAAIVAAVSARNRHALSARPLRRGRRLGSLRPSRPAVGLSRIIRSGHATGERRRQGAITKAGSTHARRLLIEAAYHY